MAEAKVLTAQEVHDLVAGYMNEDHVKKVDKAYDFAYNLHKEQKRKSGEPYIIHPIQVAGILADLHMDPELSKIEYKSSREQLAEITVSCCWQCHTIFVSSSLSWRTVCTTCVR